MNIIYDQVIKYDLTGKQWSNGVYHLMLKSIFYDTQYISKALLGHIEYYKSFIESDTIALKYETDLNSIYQNLNLQIKNFEDFGYDTKNYYIKIPKKKYVCYLSDIDYLLGLAYRIENNCVVYVNKQLIALEFILNAPIDTQEWFADETRTNINGWIPICFNYYELPVYILHNRLFGNLYLHVKKINEYFKRQTIPQFQRHIYEIFYEIYKNHF